MALQSFTVCFNGTSTPIEEGEEDIPPGFGELPGWLSGQNLSGQAGSEAGMYDALAGYMPTRIWKNFFSRHTAETTRPRGEPHMGALVRGVGTRYFFRKRPKQVTDSEGNPLFEEIDLDPINPGLRTVKFPVYSAKEMYATDTWFREQRTRTFTKAQWLKRTLAGLAKQTDFTAFMEGNEMWDLAEHGAVIVEDALTKHVGTDRASWQTITINLLGHSRGGVTAWLCAYYLYAFGVAKDRQVNVFSIDPVPGAGNWHKYITQLPANVNRFMGVYAWDNNKTGFGAAVPRPNRTNPNNETSGRALSPEDDWGYVAGPDPLAPADPSSRWKQSSATSAYNLIICRGTHGTPAGNATKDGTYKAMMCSSERITVPRMSYYLALHFLGLDQPPDLTNRTLDLWRAAVAANCADYDKMRTGMVGELLNVTTQTIASDPGRDMRLCHFMIDILPPGTLPPHYYSGRAPTGVVSTAMGMLSGSYRLAERSVTGGWDWVKSWVVTPSARLPYYDELPPGDRAANWRALEELPPRYFGLNAPLGR